MIRQIFFPEGKIFSRADDFARLHFDDSIYEIEAHARSPLPNYRAANTFILFRPNQKGQYIAAGQYRQPLTKLFRGGS
jgi:hypothetical protein